MQSTPSRTDLDRAARILTRSAAACAAFCEHVEHNEPTTTHGLVQAAADMRALATDLAETIGLGLPEAYASRIRGVEAASLLRFAADPRNPVYSGAEALREAKRWDEIQVGQVIHDRQFHPDVFGLSKVDQLRHYTFHVAKLAGMLVDAIENEDWDGFGEMRLADIAIFGVKLSTVCNERLPESSVHRLSLESDADRLVGHLQAPRPAAR